MKQPTVKLKTLKTFKGHDGTGVSADVYINGKKCFSVFDGAYGGELDIHYYDFDKRITKEQARESIDQLLKHIDTLKDINSLEDYINELINTEIEIKEEKRFEKQCMDSICFGIPQTGNYSRMSYKKPLSSFPKEALQMMVNNIKDRYCTNGVVILNKNLEALGVKL